MALFLVRYGEIALKTRPVRSRMENCLVSNIRGAFEKSGVNARVARPFGRIFVETNQAKKARSILKRVFGIVSFSECLSCKAEIGEIKYLALKIAKKEKFRSFAVKARRVGTHPFTSQKINEEVGAEIAGLGKKVDLSGPEKIFFIEVRDKKTYICTEKIPGLGGFPLGTQGRAIALLENEKDVLAAWLFMRRGCEVVPVTGKNSFVKTLEKWSCKKMESYKNLDAAVKKEKLLGVVTSDFSKTEKLKKELGVPVYNPLLGMDEREITRMKKFIAEKA